MRKKDGTEEWSRKKALELDGTNRKNKDDQPEGESFKWQEMTKKKDVNVVHKEWSLFNLHPRKGKKTLVGGTLAGKRRKSL